MMRSIAAILVIIGTAIIVTTIMFTILSYKTMLDLGAVINVSILTAIGLLLSWMATPIVYRLQVERPPPREDKKFVRARLDENIIL